MVDKKMIAALVGLALAGSASAEGAGDGLNLGYLSWIRDTVCQADREIVFIPVSNDVPAVSMTFAVVPLDRLDASSAHVVTVNERRWLATHGCNAPAEPGLTYADTPSGGLDNL